MQVQVQVQVQIIQTKQNNKLADCIKTDLLSPEELPVNSQHMSKGTVIPGVHMLRFLCEDTIFLSLPFSFSSSLLSPSLLLRFEAANQLEAVCKVAHV